MAATTSIVINCPFENTGAQGSLVAEFKPKLVLVGRRGSSNLVSNDTFR